VQHFGYVLLGSCHMHIFMPSFGGRGLFCSKCHTLYSCSIPRMYYSWFIIAKHIVLYVYMFSSYNVLLFGIMCLLSVVDSLIAQTMWNHCNNINILVDCNVVNYNQRNSTW